MQPSFPPWSTPRPVPSRTFLAGPSAMAMDETADDSAPGSGFARHKRPRLDAPAPVALDRTTTQAVQEAMQQAKGLRRPMLVGTAAARQQEPAGVWCFVPYGSQALSALESGPVVRIGFDPSGPPTRLLSLPNEVLCLVTDYLCVADFSRLAQVHRLFTQMFRRQIRSSSWANRIVEYAWEREPAGRRRKNSFFSLSHPHPVGKDVLPLVTCVTLPCSTPLQVRNLAALTPHVRQLDCSWLDTEFFVPANSDILLSGRMKEALLLWPQLEQLVGNRSIAPSLRYYAGTHRRLQRLAAVGFQLHSPGGREVLAPMSYDDSPIGFDKLVPWLKPSVRRTDPYFLLDIAGLEHLSVALKSVDDLGPRPREWERIYGSDTAREPRGKLIAFEHAPLFFKRKKGPRELLLNLRARVPGWEETNSLSGLRDAASAAAPRMMQSDRRTLAALLRALLRRLNAEPNGSLHTMQLGVALPFFSFLPLVVPLWREMGIATTQASLWSLLWQQGPEENGDASAHALLQEVFDRAPGFGFRLIGQESTWVATRSHPPQRPQALVWQKQKTHELRGVAFSPPATDN